MTGAELVSGGVVVLEITWNVISSTMLYFPHLLTNYALCMQLKASGKSMEISLTEVCLTPRHRGVKSIAALSLKLLPINLCTRTFEGT